MAVVYERLSLPAAIVYPAWKRTTTSTCVSARCDSLPCMEKNNNFNLHCQLRHCQPVSESDGSSTQVTGDNVCGALRASATHNGLRAATSWSPAQLPTHFGLGARSVLVTGLDLFIDFPTFRGIHVKGSSWDFPSFSPRMHADVNWPVNINSLVGTV